MPRAKAAKAAKDKIVAGLATLAEAIETFFRLGRPTSAMKTPLLAFGALLLALSGCESDRGSRFGGGAGAPDAAPAAAPFQEMEANGKFLDGKLETEVLLSKGGFAPRAAKADGSNGGGRGGGFHGGFGGGGGGRRGGGGMGGMGGGRGGGGEMPAGRGPARESEDGGPPRPPIRASNEAPVQLHVRLTNHGAEAMEVEVSEFNSDLGNFVVLPRKFTIPAGESVEAEPMTSRLGVKADEISLIVTVRSGGHTEKQTLALKAKPPEPQPAPAT